MGATLIILAAGRSTRFGRPKQLEPVGPHGEALLDHTLRDAFRAGCSDAVLVVRPEHLPLFKERLGGRPDIGFAVQHEARGTAHAVMLALEHARGTVIIANGDDLYGEGPLRMAVQHAREGNAVEHALVGYELANTLSASGGVNRAICTTGADGLLLHTEEVTGLQAGAEGSITDGHGQRWRGDALVSMNLWVMRPTVFHLFAELPGNHGYSGSEIGLPTVVRAAIARHQAFRVLPTTEAWCGLTYAADADLVRRTLALHP